MGWLRDKFTGILKFIGLADDPVAESTQTPSTFEDVTVDGEPFPPEPEVVFVPVTVEVIREVPAYGAPPDPTPPKDPRVQTGGNYSYTRIGHKEWRLEGRPGPRFFTLTGNKKMGNGPWVYCEWQFNGYPLVIDRDTIFVGTNFCQAEPHTEIFQVVPKDDGSMPRICFGHPQPKDAQDAFRGECNLINVKVPDHAEIYGGNLLHGFDTPTDNPDRPTVKTLCACEKCCVVRPIIQEVITYGNKGALRDQHGRWLHHELKTHYAARRESPEMMAAHQEQILIENDEAVAWLDPRQAEAVQ